MKRKLEELNIKQTLIGYNDMPPKRRKSSKKDVIEKYNLEKVKATEEWIKETFEITNARKKGEELELKTLSILRAQNIIANLSKAHIVTETKLQKIIGDGGIDLFGEIIIQGQTLQ